MAIVKFSYGKPQRDSVAGSVNKDKSNNIKLSECVQNQTVYSNLQQFSGNMPTRYPKGEGKLCKNVFDEPFEEKGPVLTKTKKK